MKFKHFLQEETNFSPEDLKKMKPVVISPGRFNPPHLGHKLVVSNLVKLGKKLNATPVVIIVDSGKRDEKNPLSGAIRKEYLSKMFPGLRIEIAKNPYEAVAVMGEEGRVPVGGITGSDRADSYKKMVGRIFGPEVEGKYTASILHRDPDADDVKGISASRVRAAAKAKDVAKVRAMTGLNHQEGTNLTKLLIKGMGG